MSDGGDYDANLRRLLNKFGDWEWCWNILLIRIREKVEKASPTERGGGNRLNPILGFVANPTWSRFIPIVRSKK